MADVIVEPHEDGWAVRHPRRLHERFERRADALRLATEHARQLSRQGETCLVRALRGGAPRPLPRA